MGPSPVVTGISPKEATAGTKITIRGENLGVSQQDLLGVLILGCDSLLTTEWKSANKLVALCPGGAKEGSGDIVVATRSGGLGSCTVRLRVFRESVGPLKEVAVWTQEKFYPRVKRGGGFSSPGGGPSEHDDALGLSVEGAGQGLPEGKLATMFPGKSSDVGADNFDPAYFLLENHPTTTFEDLQAGLGYLRRKVDGENESQLSFIKANISSIMDQLDTLKGVKKRFEIDTKQFGKNPTARVEKAIAQAKKEADQMFVDVLGRKDSADATRNAINVLNRFRFLFNLPANIEANLARGDYDRIIDEYSRAKSLYGDSDSEIFRLYLDEVEKGVAELKSRLWDRLRDPSLPMEQQKKLVANLVQLEAEGDPAWECLENKHRHVVSALDACMREHAEGHRRDLDAQQQKSDGVASASAQQFPSSPSSKNLLLAAEKDGDELQDAMPETVLFVQDVTDLMEQEFPDLWRLGQSYFKGDLVVEADPDKSPAFKSMILGDIKHFSNLIRAAVIPQTLQKADQTEESGFGEWGEEPASGEKATANWLPTCLRHVRKCYASFIDLDLPGQALDIVKQLTTDLRIQCLQIIFQTVIDQVHLLHEKEEWAVETTDECGAVTEVPDMFEKLVSQSVQLIKEALLSSDRREEDILSYESAHSDLEILIQNVLSSFAFTLENAAVENYTSLSNIPPDSTRLLLCRNNCRLTQSHILPKIQKSFQEVGQLSLEKPIAETNKCYNILDGKLFEAYLELKCDPIVAMIEPSMYVGKFDWARCPKPTDARDYVKEILHSVVAVQSEVQSVSSLNPSSPHNSVRAVLRRVVYAAAEEVNRLFCGISRMNSNGCIQAWVDIHCLRSSLGPLLTETASEYLSDAAKPLYDLERPGDREVIDGCIAEFGRRMRFHVSAIGSVG